MFVELVILAVLVTLVVIGMRCGRAAVPDIPIIVHQPGHYHITLAPQLGGAQPFIENIATQFAGIYRPQGDIPTRYFEVHDPNIPVPGEKFYLLAAAFRGGTLYFQAINPQPLLRDADSRIKTVRDFSGAVLALHPLAAPADEQGAEKLCEAVDSAAQPLQITVKILQETG